MNEKMSTEGTAREEDRGVTLVELSELALRGDPKFLSDRLAERGHPLKSPSSEWRPLAGGIEYNHYVAEQLPVDGLSSSLTVEISRERDNPEHIWLNSFDLRPGTFGPAEWLEKIRELLLRDFESVPSRGGGAETYSRGTRVEALLFAGSSDEPPNLLIRTRSLIRNR